MEEIWRETAGYVWLSMSLLEHEVPGFHYKTWSWPFSSWAWVQPCPVRGLGAFAVCSPPVQLSVRHVP